MLHRIEIHCRPDLINEGILRLKVLLFLLRIPGTHFQESEHVHLINLVHPPTRLEQDVVGFIDVFRQRQGLGMVCASSSSASCVTGLVGKASNTSVVCD